jgi:hypothetical protein
MSDFSLAVDQDGPDTLVLTFDGDLDGAHAPRARAAVDRLFIASS